MKRSLQAFLPVAAALFAISATTGCYVRKERETVHEPTASTTIDRSTTTTDTVPEVQRRTTTVEHY
jgi:hypothetical protein